MRWLDFVWLAPVFVAMGCGNTVTSNPGGGGSGASTAAGGTGGDTGMGGAGAGNTNTTTTTPTTTTSTTTPTTTSTTTPSGSPCDQACGKVEMCGLPPGQCQMFLDCGNPQGTCFADCVNEPSVDCGAIFAALQGNPGPLTTCIQDCQGGGQGGAGGSPGMDCNQCAQNSCAAEFGQCVQQAGFQECQDWATCAAGCGDAACLDGCTFMYPSGAAIEQCACSSCPGECANLCNGGGMGGAGGMGMGGAGMGGAGGGNADPAACQSCGQQQCGAEIQQCLGANFQQCQAWFGCVQNCMDKPCVDGCTAMNPVGAPVAACVCMDCLNGGCGYLCQ